MIEYLIIMQDNGDEVGPYMYSAVNNNSVEQLKHLRTEKLWSR